MADHQDDDDVIFVKVSHDPGAVSRKRPGQSGTGKVTVQAGVVLDSQDVSTRKRPREIRLAHLDMVRDTEVQGFKVRSLISKALDDSLKGDFINAFCHAYDGVQKADEVLAGISAEFDGREPEVSLTKSTESSH